MEYNDLVIIILLIVLIITVFFKNDNTHLLINANDVKDKVESFNCQYISPNDKNKKKYIDNTKNKTVKSIYSKKNNNKNIIVDNYSEYDNIKSLNSMDNTLSDVVSIVNY